MTDYQQFERAIKTAPAYARAAAEALRQFPALRANKPEITCESNCNAGRDEDRCHLCEAYDAAFDKWIELWAPAAIAIEEVVYLMVPDVDEANGILAPFWEEHDLWGPEEFSKAKRRRLHEEWIASCEKSGP